MAALMRKALVGTDNITRRNVQSKEILSAPKIDRRAPVCKASSLPVDCEAWNIEVCGGLEGSIPDESHVGSSSGGLEQHHFVRLGASSLHTRRADRHSRNGKSRCARLFIEEPLERDCRNVSL